MSHYTVNGACSYQMTISVWTELNSYKTFGSFLQFFGRIFFSPFPVRGCWKLDAGGSIIIIGASPKMVNIPKTEDILQVLLETWAVQGDPI